MDIQVQFDEITLSEEELQEKCIEWQKTLRLQDWDIKVGVVRERDLSGSKRQGEVQWTLSKKMASISILNPIDYPEDLMAPQDMEITLVHELLHLHFAPFDTFEYGTPEDTATEQAVHVISTALVKLKRGEYQYSKLPTIEFEGDEEE